MTNLFSVNFSTPMPAVKLPVNKSNLHFGTTPVKTSDEIEKTPARALGAFDVWPPADPNLPSEGIKPAERLRDQARESLVDYARNHKTRNQISIWYMGVAGDPVTHQPQLTVLYAPTSKWPLTRNEKILWNKANLRDRLVAQISATERQEVENAFLKPEDIPTRFEKVAKSRQEKRKTLEALNNELKDKDGEINVVRQKNAKLQVKQEAWLAERLQWVESALQDIPHDAKPAGVPVSSWRQFTLSLINACCTGRPLYQRDLTCGTDQKNCAASPIRSEKSFKPLVIFA